MLRWAVAGDPRSSKCELIGTALRYQALDTPPRCLGHTDRGAGGATHVDCSKVPTGGRQCERCATVDNVVAASMHQAHKLGRGAVDGRISNHLDQPHRLYIATFPDGSIKVGTTAGERGGHRLIEQGAWLAAYVVLAKDGFAAREAEDLVTELLEVPQAVTVQRKIAGLVRPRPDAELQSALDSAADRTRQLIARVNDERLQVIDSQWENPAREQVLWSGVRPYPANLASGTHDVTVAGAVGRAVALRRPGFDEVFIADLGVLFGLAIELGDHQPDELAVQGSLL